MLERSRARPTTRLHTLLLEPPSLSLFAAVRTVATVATVGDTPLARSLALPWPLSRSLALWLASMGADSGAPAAAPLSHSLSRSLARLLALSRALSLASRGAADAPRRANWRTSASTRQYLYFCSSEFVLLHSSKASKISTRRTVASTRAAAERDRDAEAAVPSSSHKSAALRSLLARAPRANSYRPLLLLPIRWHASAYVRTRPHTSAYVCIRKPGRAPRSNSYFPLLLVSVRRHMSAYVSIRQHTSVYVRMLIRRSRTSCSVTPRPQKVTHT
jgi:hypothetical protein